MAAYVEDTIAAIATALGAGAISILRVSGREACAVASKLVRTKAGGPLDLSSAESHRARQICLVRPDDGSVIDQALLVPMHGPRSYTGEDTIEVQCHGGRLIADLALRAALAAGARAARPGEFTERAFLNGRMDLCQAEAVADMITSTSEAALELARRQLDGQLSTAVLEARDAVLDARALVEAHLDFPEEDLPSGVEQELQAMIAAVKAALASLASTYDRGRSVRDGVRIVLAGKPNVGKSSLMNALLGRERALVSAEPGTTRDYLEEPVSLGLQQALICDTAGVRDAEGHVERAGVERSLDLLTGADVVVLVVDGSRPLDTEDAAVARRARGKRLVGVRNKCDLPEASGDGVGDTAAISWLPVSATTGVGVDALAAALAGAMPAEELPAEGALVTNARHFEGLVRGQDAMSRASEVLGETQELELVAAELQEGCCALDELVGRSDVEDVLDRVFSRFCVGK